MNNITSTEYTSSYIELINEIHGIWPAARIILISLWGGFGALGNTYVQVPAFLTEIPAVYEYFQSPNLTANGTAPFVCEFSLNIPPPNTIQ